MSGYKISVIEDGAVAFWTFDGDAFNSENRNLIVPNGEPNYIIDEIDNKNPGILYTDDEQYLGYRLGMESLIELEQQDNHSITFGYYGYRIEHPNGYAKSYIEIPHSPTLSIWDGAFTIEMLINLKTQQIKNINQNIDIEFPIFVKSDIIEINYKVLISNNATSLNNSLVIKNAEGKHFFNKIISKQGWENQVIHLVVVSNGSEPSVYANSFKVERSSFIESSNPSTPGAGSIYIGATPDSTPLIFSIQLDQIALYDKAFTEDDVANHTRKCYSYENLLKKCYASEIWTFSDPDNVDDLNINPLVGLTKGKYEGDLSRFIREWPGPEGLLKPKCCRFNGGLAQIIKLDNLDKYSPRGFNQYTYEWWFNIDSINPGVMFAFQEFEYPFRGCLVLVNVRNNATQIGSIQFSESVNDFVINSPENEKYNDNKWHHIVLTKNSDGDVKMYLDGELCGQALTKYTSITRPGQITMMNSMPGNQLVSGSIYCLTCYPFALQEHQIKSHFNYSITYKIRGIVTLMGIPYRARLRFYSSHTGELIKEVDSDAQTGEYSVNFDNNNNIDILAFSPYDPSIRYRAYGPVTPSPLEDLPIQI